MKKLTLALGVAAALTAGSSAMAQDSDTLTVNGSVPLSCVLSLDDQWAGSFNIMDPQMQKVAEVTASCNNTSPTVDVQYDPQDDGSFAIFQGPGTNTIRYNGEVNPPGGAASPVLPGPYVLAQQNGSASEVTLEPILTGSEQEGTYTTVIEIEVSY